MYLVNVKGLNSFPSLFWSSDCLALCFPQGNIVKSPLWLWIFDSAFSKLFILRLSASFCFKRNNLPAKSSHKLCALCFADISILSNKGSAQFLKFFRKIWGRRHGFFLNECNYLGQTGNPGCNFVPFCLFIACSYCYSYFSTF